MSYFHDALKLLFTVLLICCSEGCVPVETDQSPAMFDSDLDDATLNIIVDTSSSFRRTFEMQGGPLMSKVIVDFMQQNAGKDIRITISQMQARDNVVLFEGGANEFRKQFKAPESLLELVESAAEPNTFSPVFVATGKSIRYANEYLAPSLKPGGRLLTVIYSDMVDTEPNRATRSQEGHQMLAELERYRGAGGRLALYCVTEEERTRWFKIVDLAGFERSDVAIFSDRVADPDLPQWY
ncbi:hypothetical protein FF011L_12520 [Roseimaritima multifibrata]|uniref:VWFA domain-containing protein n=1 Tax=Roseimaritima multifibrata TaxID=1930274 RepID=A0A517MCE4_9BACT|nr:hypothetical protein [Roseimaritima multifibrata]QDS92506.1 hypothetical protein FF011L_12520 [Roseimaritima multifibrata]